MSIQEVSLEAPLPTHDPVMVEAMQTASRHTRRIVHAYQLVIVIAILGLWQGVPEIPGIRGVFKFADPFFISSPSRVAVELWKLITGTDGVASIWPAFARTMLSALSGTALALVVGAFLGLLLSNSPKVTAVTRPFLSFFNAIPRIALIPIIILIIGTSEMGDATTAFSVVVFLVFYTAFEGSSSIPVEVIQNARLLGANRKSVMWHVRWPYVLGWTFGVMPVAIAFGLVGSVTAEIFTGSSGIGQDLTTATNTVDASLTFAIVIILAVVGVFLSLGTDALRKRALPWWEGAA